MSQDNRGVLKFFRWLMVGPRCPTERDSPWKQKRLRELGGLEEGVLKVICNDLRPADELVQSYFLIRKYIEKVRGLKGYSVGQKGDANHFAGESLYENQESERKFLAVLTAQYLYPKASAFNKIIEEWKKKGINRDVRALRQGFYRFGKKLGEDKRVKAFYLARLYYRLFILDKRPIPMPDPQNIEIPAYINAIVEKAKPRSRRKHNDPGNGGIGTTGKRKTKRQQNT